MIASHFCHFLKLISRNVSCQQPSRTVLRNMLSAGNRTTALVRDEL
jgi:hypothetical protein